MITKPLRRRSGRDAFGPLIEYTTQPDKIEWRILNEVDSLETAAGEMEGTAFHAPQCRKPAVHLAISAAYEDHPTREQMEAISWTIADELEMRERQFVSLGHRDALHRHAHFVGNLVHPRTYQVLDYGLVYKRLYHLSRRIETQYGWRVATPPTDDREVAMRLSALTRRAWGPRLFGSWARLRLVAPVADLLASLTFTWDDLHIGLAATAGASYYPTVDGAVVRDAFDPRYYVKASHVHPELARNRLEVRLGPFRGAPTLSYNYDASFTATVVRAPRVPMPADLRARFLRDVSAYADAFGANRADERQRDTAERHARRAALLRTWRDEHAALATIPDPALRELARHARQIVALRDYQESELQMLRDYRAQRRVRPPAPRWSAWVIEQARLGDPEAIAYIRAAVPDAYHIRTPDIDAPPIAPEIADT